MRFPTSWRPIALACLVTAVTVFSVGGRDLHLAASADDEPSEQLSPGDIDTELSRVYVFVGKKRLGHEHGMEGMLQEGRIRVDSPDDPGAIVFDMSSFAADTDVAREYVGLEG